MPGKRIHLNGLELQLLSILLKIEVGITKQDEDLDREDFLALSKFCGKDVDTIKKFFYPAENLGESLFNAGTVDAIIRKAESIECDTWEIFKQKYLHNGIRSYPTRVSKTQLVPYYTRIKIEEFLQELLSDIYGDKDLSIYFPFTQTPNEQEIPPRLSEYLNTAWYAYFFYPYSGHKKYGQIIRTIIRIRPDTNIAETIRPDFEKLDIFEGRVKFDRKDRVLIYDLVTKKSGSRAVHIKQVINIDNLPKITLGEYNNIGFGGNGLHSIRLIMEYIGEYHYDAEKYYPKILDSRDPDFFKVPVQFREYLQFEKSNFRECSTDPVTSIRDLEILVAQEKANRFGEKMVRLHKKFQVIFSFPRFNISDEEYDKYKKTLTDLKEYMEAEFPFEVDDYYLSGPKPKSFERFEFYSNRIRNCDIVIGFIFQRDPSLVISELTLACEMGKKTLVLALDGTEYVPAIFRGKWPEQIFFRDEYTSLEEAVADFKVKLKNDFKEQIDYYNASSFSDEP